MPFKSEAQRRFMYSQHPKLAKEFENATPENANLPEHVKKQKMAEGGEVEGDEIEMPKKEFVEEHENLIKNLQPAVDEQKKQAKELKEVKGEDVSDDEKLNQIYKAMGMGKFAMGGVVPTDPQLAIPNQGDPNFWENIKSALTKIAAPITKPAELATKATEAAIPAVEAMKGPGVAAINELTGANLPIPETHKAPEGTPTPLSQPVPPSPVPPAPKTPAQQVSVPGIQTGTPEKQPDITKLFDQDASKITEGYNAEDRKAVAANMADKQGGIGSIIAQAMAGLGDALAAKGGRDQHALKDIFTMQKQQRDEALANFDAERKGRLEQLDLKTKMGENAIKQLAAQDAYGSDENLNRQLGAPAGTKHKDLPLYFQMAAAKAAQSEKDADLHMRAMKQAADDVEAAVKNASMFSFKPSAEQMKAQGAKLADQYFHKAKGNVLFQPSDGQKPLWIPAANLHKAQQMDPNGKVIQ